MKEVAAVHKQRHRKAKSAGFHFWIYESSSTDVEIRESFKETTEEQRDAMRHKPALITLLHYNNTSRNKHSQAKLKTYFPNEWLLQRVP